MSIEPAREFEASWSAKEQGELSPHGHHVSVDRSGDMLLCTTAYPASLSAQKKRRLSYTWTHLGLNVWFIGRIGKR